MLATVFVAIALFGLLGIAVLAVVYTTVRRITPESLKISGTITRWASFTIEVKAAKDSHRLRAPHAKSQKSDSRARRKR
ncbi:hypothetical protein [Spirillospora sp. CA-128828]|uniref:hypothetical protein n=1 Tax=Spirillospora sp. CA-128828 TaxID=3240033 RepID=UPI003D91F219